jgi:hypothetical protein
LFKLPLRVIATSKDIIWIKPLSLFFSPSHKWDGNEILTHCRWLKPTEVNLDEFGFSLNEHDLHFRDY